MRLEHSLASIGIDLAYWTTFNFDERPDAKSLLEMGTATQECLWQLQAIVNEVRRRWEQLVVKATPANQALDEWLASVADMSAS